MTGVLTARNREYLEFIWNFIDENQSAPTLKEIAQHFHVTSPTAHKALEELQNLGHIKFGRSKFSGFYIRLIERYDSNELTIEIPVVGHVNQLGELYDYPTNLGHFVTLLLDSQPGELYALQMAANIPQAELLGHDVLIWEHGVAPYEEDICIVSIGKRRFLIEIVEVIPGKGDQEETKYAYRPIAYCDDTHETFMAIVEEEDWDYESIPESLIFGTVLRMTRHLAF